MKNKLNSNNVAKIDSNAPESMKPSVFQLQSGLRAGWVRPEEAFVLQNWDQVSAGLDSFFDRVDAAIDIF